jgi:branched-chain amino acid transport system ATP-binding protein
MMLCLESIYAGYGKKEILRGVSISIAPGQVVALVGVNGAGKSTLLKVAMGLVSPRRGLVRLNEKDITHLPVHERPRLGLSYFLQGGGVFPSLNVKENLDMGSLPLAPAIRASETENVLELLPILKDHLYVRAGLLSGGQRQALALAMVLAQRPKVLLLDEPSAGLAPKVAQEFLLQVRHLNERLGVTILMVEQRVREALEVAHRAVVLLNGELVAETNDPGEWIPDGVIDAHFFGNLQHQRKIM